MQSFLQYRRFGQQLQKQYGLQVQTGNPTLLPNSSRVVPEENARDVDSEFKSSNDSPSSSAERTQELGEARTDKGTEVETEKWPSNVVDYEGEEDPMKPQNWSIAKRMAPTILVTAIGFIVSWASAIDSAALRKASAEFGVSEVTESLATGLYLIAFGLGSLFAGPLSEVLGRNPVYVITMSLYMIFIMASALAPNISSQLVFRFLAGFFGNTPLTCAGGSLSDLWSHDERTYAIPLFSIAIFQGPMLGAVVGGWIEQSSSLSWRWTDWITLIMSGLILGLVVLFQPETHTPTLLRWKAAQLRKISGNKTYRSPSELQEDVFLHRIQHALSRPFMLLFQEPIVMLVALYLTVIYIVFFTFLDGFTFIFSDTYGFSEGLTGTAFAAIAVGLCLPALFMPFISRWTTRRQQALEKAGDTRPQPELRLWFAMLGAVALPVSLLWMGWTNYSSISSWSGLGAAALFGFSVLCVYISFYQYVIDSYEEHAASALASVTVIRYVASGAMVPVAIPMYRNLGVHWTLTLLGCLAALLLPVPFIFYRFGFWIRSKSKTFRGRSPTET